MNRNGDGVIRKAEKGHRRRRKGLGHVVLTASRSVLQRFAHFAAIPLPFLSSSTPSSILIRLRASTSRPTQDLRLRFRFRSQRCCPTISRTHTRLAPAYVDVGGAVAGSTTTLNPAFSPSRPTPPPVPLVTLTVVPVPPTTLPLPPAEPSWPRLAKVTSPRPAALPSQP
ncbi:hypothetical protein A4X06_0g7799 [Tilletia controversa]|uniref:Uncharacterized protein n=1 Tax=Tilletia controversa TaxID=13291 RepID=A0A8X7MMB0_9BASI|nr:hypothetical protein CF328_g3243 [Tilletia controversa]KAE8240361.1 hypothetical protein A4X06_0g7799 [Tilletia controversa]